MKIQKTTESVDEVDFEKSLEGKRLIWEKGVTETLNSLKNNDCSIIKYIESDVLIEKISGKILEQINVEKMVNDAFIAGEKRILNQVSQIVDPLSTEIITVGELFDNYKTKIIDLETYASEDYTCISDI